MVNSNLLKKQKHHYRSSYNALIIEIFVENELFTNWSWHKMVKMKSLIYCFHWNKHIHKMLRSILFDLMK